MQWSQENVDSQPKVTILWIGCDDRDDLGKMTPFSEQLGLSRNSTAIIDLLEEVTMQKIKQETIVDFKFIIQSIYFFKSGFC